MIRVRSGVEPTRVALWERHDDHPNGEVFIKGTAVVEVAQTQRVTNALKDGRLVEVKTISKAKRSKRSK